MTGFFTNAKIETIGRHVMIAALLFVNSQVYDMIKENKSPDPSGVSIEQVEKGTDSMSDSRTISPAEDGGYAP